MIFSVTGCSGRDVLLGDGPEGGGGASAGDWPAEFREIRAITPLRGEGEDDDPTATGDLLELYFNSDRSGGKGQEDIWLATRQTVRDPWDDPRPVTELNSERRETSPAVEADGLTLWFSSDRGDEQTLEVWRSRRSSRESAWSEPELVVELSGLGDLLPRPSAQGATVLPLAKRETGKEAYDLFVALRSSSDQPWSEPVPLTELNTERSEADPFMMQNGLQLLFATASGGGDLVAARRMDGAQRFSEPWPIEQLNSDSEERDPWLSEDGAYMLFASDRDGDLEIYEAIR